MRLAAANGPQLPFDGSLTLSQDLTRPTCWAAPGVQPLHVHEALIGLSARGTFAFGMPWMALVAVSTT